MAKTITKNGRKYNSVTGKEITKKFGGGKKTDQEGNLIELTPEYLRAQPINAGSALGVIQRREQEKEKLLQASIMADKEFEELEKTAEANIPKTATEKINLLNNPEAVEAITARQEAQKDKLGILGNIPQVAVASNLVAVGSESVPAVGKAFISSVSDYADNIRAITSLGGRDTADVKTAREKFKLITSTLDEDIVRVSQGLENSNDVERKITDALTATLQMEREVKGKGLRNLRYWALGGVDVEVEVGLNKELLKRQLASLIAVRGGQ